MAVFSLNEVEQDLSYLTIEELLELEEKIMKVVKKKVKNHKNGDWKRDFLEISVWNHLDDAAKVKVDKWGIEKF